MSEKLSLLDPADPLTGDELAYVVQDGESRQTTAQDIADLAAGASFASAAEIQAGTATGKPIDPDGLFDAAAPVTLTYANPTTAVDMATGINFNLTLTGDSELGSPTNEKPGQSGRIRVTQDGTGGHSLTYGADWQHVGSTPAIDETAGAVNIFAYFVNAVGDVELSYLGVLA